QQCVVADGHRSGSVYVGQIKGVIDSICSGCQTLDVAHDIPPGDPEQVVGEGAFLLERSYGFFPPATLFLCVVDPGVGTDRKVLLLEAGKQLFVAPDNGLLAPVVDSAADSKIVSIEETRWFLEPRSNTFHGRDVFAALAAHIARGLRRTGLGPVLEPADIVKLPGEPATETVGRVRSIDRFGNLITDVVPRGDVETLRAVTVGDHTLLRRARTFAEAEGEDPFFTVGGLGTVEIVCRGSSAQKTLEIDRGVRVEVAYVEEEADQSP
ncbi:S-adenosyl-l-methionine hydroxide adenosyltransferase family protein, partial [Planctomycetota bacterium]